MNRRIEGKNSLKKCGFCWKKLSRKINPCKYYFAKSNYKNIICKRKMMTMKAYNHQLTNAYLG